jgi:hypothetical protein
MVFFDITSTPPLRVLRTAPQEPVFEDECVELFWEGGKERGHYVEIVVNPAGALYTARVANPDGDRTTWKVSPVLLPGVEIEVTGFPEGPPSQFVHWTCQLFAPWRVLSPSALCPRPGDVHRGNAFHIAREEIQRFEALSATGRTPPDFHVPARFASFVFAPAGPETPGNAAFPLGKRGPSKV